MSALDLARPILDVLRTLDVGSSDATKRLEALLPFQGEVVRTFGAEVVAGVRGGALVPRSAGDVKFGRLAKATDATLGFSIDVVDMHGPGGAHTHPNGEIDLSFALEGDPRFDGHPPGWVVLAPGTWHVPTVTGGRMAIVYFLPGGAITFEEKPNRG